VPLNKQATRRLGLAPGEVELIPDGIAHDYAWKFSVYRAMPGGSRDDKPLVSRSDVTGAQVVTLPEGAYRMEFQHPGVTSPKFMSLHAEAERRHAFDVVFDSKLK
jgi:hypothetical protein